MIFRPRNVVSKVNRIFEEAKMSGYEAFSSVGGESKSSRSAGTTAGNSMSNRQGSYRSNVDDTENPTHASSKQSASAAYFPLSSAAAASTSSRAGYGESKGQSPSNARNSGSFAPQSVFSMPPTAESASAKNYRSSGSEKGFGASSKND
jgi:hypothetical protein